MSCSVRSIDKEGKPGEACVTRHWRQHWRYENRTLIEYQGRNTWQGRALAKQDAADSRITLTGPVDQGALFVPLFQYADSLMKNAAPVNTTAQAKLIDQTLSSMIR